MYFHALHGSTNGEIMWDNLLYKYGIERLYSSSSNTATVSEYTNDAMWLNVI